MKAQFMMIAGLFLIVTQALADGSECNCNSELDESKVQRRDNGSCMEMKCQGPSESIECEGNDESGNDGLWVVSSEGDCEEAE